MHTKEQLGEGAIYTEAGGFFGEKALKQNVGSYGRFGICPHIGATAQGVARKLALDIAKTLWTKDSSGGAGLDIFLQDRERGDYAVYTQTSFPPGDTMYVLQDAIYHALEKFDIPQKERDNAEEFVEALRRASFARDFDAHGKLLKLGLGAPAEYLALRDLGMAPQYLAVNYVTANHESKKTKLWKSGGPERHDWLGAVTERYKQLLNDEGLTVGQLRRVIFAYPIFIEGKVYKLDIRFDHITNPVGQHICCVSYEMEVKDNPDLIDIVDSTVRKAGLVINAPKLDMDALTTDPGLAKSPGIIQHRRPRNIVERMNRMSQKEGADAFGVVSPLNLELQYGIALDGYSTRQQIERAHIHGAWKDRKLAPVIQGK